MTLSEIRDGWSKLGNNNEHSICIIAVSDGLSNHMVYTTYLAYVTQQF